MTRAAAIAVLLAAAAFAGEEGAELVYEFGEGEGLSAAKVLARRLELLGVEGAQAKALEDGRRVAIRLDARDRLEDVRAAVARVGRLELRRVVNPDTPNYGRHRKQFDAALARGIEPAKACDVATESLTKAERERWPGGLRWYRNPNPKEGLKEDWLLCELDGWGISDEAFEEIQAARSVMQVNDITWAVHFDVKEGCRERMAELTKIGEEEGARLAAIVDGEVIAAPVLHNPLRANGQITMGDEAAARSLAVAFGGRLPSKPKLILERVIDR